MTVKVRIPTQLRSLTSGLGQIDAEGETVGQVLNDVNRLFPGFNERVFDEEGKLRRFVNVFLADEDVRFLDGLETPVKSDQVISVVPAVAGG
jgi:molybdopterin converting factor small subunit